MLTYDQRLEAARLFAMHGYSQPLVVARVVSDDERIFVVPAGVLAKLPERTLTIGLQQALHRKVWIVSASSSWADTEPLR